MPESAFKPILLDLIRDARRAQVEFVAALDATERAAIGTPDHWSAKDHVAHMTFWRQQLILKLQAIVAHETPAGLDDYDQLIHSSSSASGSGPGQRSWPSPTRRMTTCSR